MGYIFRNEDVKKNKFLKFSIFLLFFFVFIDQYIKYIVVKRFDLYESCNFIGSLIKIKYVRNYGAAFSVFLNKTKFLIFFTILIIFVFLVFLIRKKIKDNIKIFSATVIFAGGIGNLIDRLFRGFVVDYINLKFFPSIFNFADCLVVFGSILFLSRFIKIEISKNKLRK